MGNHLCRIWSLDWRRFRSALGALARSGHQRGYGVNLRLVVARAVGVTHGREQVEGPEEGEVNRPLLRRPTPRRPATAASRWCRTRCKRWRRGGQRASQERQRGPTVRAAASASKPRRLPIRAGGGGAERGDGCSAGKGQGLPLLASSGAQEGGLGAGSPASPVRLASCSL